MASVDPNGAPLTGEEVVTYENLNFREDLYEFAACALIRDVALLSHTKSGGTKQHQKHNRGLRRSRVFFCALMLYGNIFTQVFLIEEVKRLISSMAVNHIRDIYSDYELAMYGEGNTVLTVNGKHRGIAGYMKPGNFETIDETTKMEVCQIPLSQPYFLAVILFIWSLTCIGEISNSLALFYSLVVRLPTVASMTEAVQVEGKQDEESPDETGGCNRLVVGLTCGMKIFISISIILPQLAIACVLLWLGCRWLLATNSFADVMLNAVALEFIFLLKDLLYRTVVSDRNKMDVERTAIKVGETTRTSTASIFLKTGWVPVTLLWVVVYMRKLQAVLPQYRWDVHVICEAFLAKVMKA